jgi:wobble nucleotide-excising tRNase
MLEIDRKLFGLPELTKEEREKRRAEAKKRKELREKKEEEAKKILENMKPIDVKVPLSPSPGAPAEKIAESGAKLKEL